MASDILEKIVGVKRQELVASSAACSLTAMRARAEAAIRERPVRGFESSIRARIDAGRPAVIAEIKKASPSKGVLREDFDPVAIAVSYQAAGAACLSVLTDERFFQGSLAFMESARAACALPVLRKDFIVDAYQIFEARTHGADCILLIVACLDDVRLREFESIANSLGMDVLVEVHDAAELDRALMLETALLGINNRNLRSFEVSLDTTISLLNRIDDQRIVITESGILGRADVERMRRAGVHAFLVGEVFMRAPDPGAALRELFV
jgi:indole-3-glycerol phosphate synthase